MEKIHQQGTPQLADWLKFYCLRGISEQRKIAMMMVGKTPAEAVLAEPQQWREWFPDSKNNKIEVSGEAIERIHRWLDNADGVVITFDDPRFPSALKVQAAPPILLFVYGQLEVMGEDRIAFVGGRRATPGGVSITQKLVRPLADAGITIVSGLALGIDVAAHTAALATRGNTIAVLGAGPDIIYPKQNHRIFEKILDTGGAIVSEFLPGSGPVRRNFPRRNRIISGLSQAVVVVEAALKSGSLITARIAAEQGRIVCAVPGSALSPMSAGCHQLLRNGATLVSSAEHILEEVFPSFEPSIDRRNIMGTPALDSLDEDKKSLLELLDYDSTSIESLVCRSGLTADKVSSILVSMEFDQVVARRLDGTYARLH